MAEILNEELGPDEVLVEKRVVPARHRHVSPLAVIILLAFAATCAFVFFGGNVRAPAAAPPPAATTGP
jgi:hypothetical protein